MNAKYFDIIHFNFVYEEEIKKFRNFFVKEKGIIKWL